VFDLTTLRVTRHRYPLDVESDVVLMVDSEVVISHEDGASFYLPAPFASVYSIVAGRNGLSVSNSNTGVILVSLVSAHGKRAPWTMSSEPLHEIQQFLHSAQMIMRPGSSEGKKMDAIKGVLDAKSVSMRCLGEIATARSHEAAISAIRATRKLVTSSSRHREEILHGSWIGSLRRFMEMVSCVNVISRPS